MGNNYPPRLSPIDKIKQNLNSIFNATSGADSKLDAILTKIENNLKELNNSEFCSTTLMKNIDDILNKLSDPEFTNKFVNNTLEDNQENANKMKQQLIELYLFQINKVLQILINIKNIKEDTSSDLDDKLFNDYLGIINPLLATVNMNLDTNGYDVSDSEDNWGILKKKVEADDKITWTNLKNNAEAESTDTLYNLLCLKQSLLDKNGQSLGKLLYKDGKPLGKITFKKIKQVDVLNGIWSEDKDKIKIVSEETAKEAGKKINLLITGFGPSAAGKSYLISKMLPKLLEKGQTKVKVSVPDVTVQIDGEIFRENNVTYTILSLLAYVKGYLGFTNLDKSGASGADFGRAMFSSFKRKLSRTSSRTSMKGDVVDELSFLNTSKLKDNFIKYLKTNIGGGSRFLNGNFNVYLPNTLTSSSFNPEEWTWLNGKQTIDFIIYLMIFQCKKGCEFCKGTTASGTERAAISGKAYSPSNYEKSLKHGLEALKNNTHGLFRLMIHNSGGKKNSGNLVEKSFIFLGEGMEFKLFSFEELNELNLINALYNFDNTVIEFNQIMSKYEFTAKASASGGSQQKRTRRKLPRKTTTKKTHKKPRKNTSHKTNNKTYTKPRKTFRKTSRKKIKYKSNPKKNTHKKKKKVRT